MATSLLTQLINVRCASALVGMWYVSRRSAHQSLAANQLWGNVVLSVVIVSSRDELFRTNKGSLMNQMNVSIASAMMVISGVCQKTVPTCSVLTLYKNDVVRNVPIVNTKV